MFPRTPFVVLACALAAGLVGCEPAAVRSFGFAQVVPGPKFHPLDRPPGHCCPAPEKKGGPFVQVEARFVDAAPASLARDFALKDGQKTAMLAAEEALQGVIALQNDSCIRTLTAPRILLRPGQKTCVRIHQHRAFVSDVTFQSGTGKGAGFMPVIDTFTEGTTLILAAEIEGGQVVLTHVEPVTANLVGIRRCTGTVARAGRLCEMRWDEALLMEGTGLLPNPCRIALKPDQALLLRLKYGLRQSTGSARLYARGPVRETLRMTGLAAGPRAAAETEAVLLIQARIVQLDKQSTTRPTK